MKNIVKKSAMRGPGLCLFVNIRHRHGMDAGPWSVFSSRFSRQRGGQRHGLGLSVVYGIVKQHEGWIVVESAPGEGTAFKMYLPSSYVR